MRILRTAAYLAGGLLAFASPLSAQARGFSSSITVEPGTPCPAGTTEIRPGRCLAPEFPAPSILDYRPESTLITAETPVPRAKYPLVDFHGHPRGLGSAEGLAQLGAAMDELNIGVMIAANSITGPQLSEVLATVEASPTMRNRVRVMTGIDFDGVGCARLVRPSRGRVGSCRGRRCRRHR